MHMMRGDLSWEDIDARLLTCFPDNRTHPFGDLPTQSLVAILGDPDDREVDRIGIHEL
jgi:hypothetical protein